MSDRDGPADGEDPAVSVVVPAYNRAHSVGTAMESVLEQTFTDLELLVVDDGSTDETRAVVTGCEDPRVRYVAHETNRGRSAARNTGIEAARGRYVAFLDSDDRWRPRKLQRQVTDLRSRGPAWVASYTDYETARGSRLTAVEDLVGWLRPDPRTREGGVDLARELLQMKVLMAPGSTLLAERSALARTGGFDTELDIHEDWDLVLALIEGGGKVAYVDEPLAVVSESVPPSAEAFAAAKRRLLDRHAGLVDRFRAEGVDVRRVHHVAVAGMYFRAGRFRAGLSYLDPDSLRPLDLLRVALWSALGLRDRLLGG
ncbi:MAG: glycosyltransferase family 2 protein [Halobacteriaceae archaeon]